MFGPRDLEWVRCLSLSKPLGAPPSPSVPRLPTLPLPRLGEMYFSSSLQGGQTYEMTPGASVWEWGLTFPICLGEEPTVVLRAGRTN